MKTTFQDALLGTCLALALAACTATGGTDPAGSTSSGTSNSSGASGTSGTTGSGTGPSGASGVNTGTTNSSIGSSPNASATPPAKTAPASTRLTIGGDG